MLCRFHSPCAEVQLQQRHILSSPPSDYGDICSFRHSYHSRDMRAEYDCRHECGYKYGSFGFPSEYSRRRRGMVGIRLLGWKRDRQRMRSSYERWRNDRIQYSGDAMNSSMALRTFAEKHRLKISRDQCNDEIVLGRRGHLYFDGPELCLLILNGPVRAKSVLKAIGGKLWTGDKSPNVAHLYRGAPAVLLVEVSGDRQGNQSMRYAPAQRLQEPLARHRGPDEGLLPLLRPIDAAPSLWPGIRTVFVVHREAGARQGQRRRAGRQNHRNPT